MRMDPLLEISGLTVTLHSSGRYFPVLTDINLSVYPGQVTTLLGASGSGKSTIAALISGVYPHDFYIIEAGNIWWKADDQVIDLLTLPPSSRMALLGRKICQIYQEPDAALNPVLTIGAQLSEIANSNDSLVQIKKLLLRLGVDPDVYWDRFSWQLSGGQQQRVLLAQAVFPRPKLIIADEPTAALDWGHQQDFLALLKECLTDEPYPGILYITHDDNQAYQLSDSVNILKQGRIVHSGPQETLQARGMQSSRPIFKAPIIPDPLNVSLKGPVLQVEQLSGGYRPLENVIHNVNFKVYSGEILGIAGDSGSGKSSILKGILGLLPLQSGEISSFGKPLNDTQKHRLCKLIYQDPGRSLNPVMTIGKAFEEIQAGNKTDGMVGIFQVLEKVQLDQGVLAKLPHMCSGGQKQRIVIAKALLNNPDVLLCDEPFSSLDPEMQYDFINLFKRLCSSEGLGVVLVAHNIPLLMEACDRICIIQSGRIIANETPKLLQASTDPEIIKFLQN